MGAAPWRGGPARFRCGSHELLRPEDSDRRPARLRCGSHERLGPADGEARQPGAGREQVVHTAGRFGPDTGRCVERGKPGGDAAREGCASRSGALVSQGLRCGPTARLSDSPGATADRSAAGAWQPFPAALDRTDGPVELDRAERHRADQRHPWGRGEEGAFGGFADHRQHDRTCRGGDVSPG